MNINKFQSHDYSDESIRKQIISAKLKQLEWLDKPRKYTVDQGKVVPTGGAK